VSFSISRTTEWSPANKFVRVALTVWCWSILQGHHRNSSVTITSSLSNPQAVITGASKVLVVLELKRMGASQDRLWSSFLNMHKVDIKRDQMHLENPPRFFRTPGWPKTASMKSYTENAWPGAFGVVAPRIVVSGVSASSRSGIPAAGGGHGLCALFFLRLFLAT
jgi:hypothetical protein